MDQPQKPGQHDPLKPRDPDTDAAMPPAGEGAPEAPPMTPTAWLINNGVYIVLFVAAIVWLYRNTGLDGLWRAFLVLIGLSFVVFIHELGHFLAAKWCDVHVTTFSLGFGPALPGCSFTRGETTYKVAVLPLGGYVAMVGEGPEADEEENYPRSFKNKSVGARMLIISAGVIMNVLLGAACFIFVYMSHGVERPIAQVYALEAGSPAWKAGARTRWDITGVAGIENPFFDDMRLQVLVSDAGQQIPFTFEPHNGTGATVRLEIEPRRDYSDIAPVVGIISGIRLQTLLDRFKRERAVPAYYASAAADARVVEFRAGDVLTEATVEGKDPVALAAGSAGVRALCKLFVEYPDKPIAVKYTRGGEAQTTTVAPVGFEFEESIVATTDPTRPDDTFAVTALPDDPSNQTEQVADPFVYRDRLRQLAGYPVALEMKRGDTSRIVLVPPAYTRVLNGVRMKMGEVAAVRDNSPASKAGFEVPKPGKDGEPGTKGDIIVKVVAVRTGADGKASTTVFENAKVPAANVRPLDPLRLGFDLQTLAKDAQKLSVKITVHRPDKAAHKDAVPVELAEIVWDPTWDDQEDFALALTSPLAISQLGLAYRVESTVDHIDAASAAAKAGLKVHDRIEKVAYPTGGKTRTDEVTWTKAFDLATERVYKQKFYDSWANVAYHLQRMDAPTVKLTVQREGKETELEVATAVDETWPSADTTRGLSFMLDRRLEKSDSLLGAVGAGTAATWRFIKLMYLNLRSLFTGRISTKTLGGPIEIAALTFSMAEDPYILILWLGMISINLAVVNFLPIPILDGGHMVFLIYELFRGRPPSQAVQAAATYVGLFLILSLMAFVIYLDVKRRFFGM